MEKPKEERSSNLKEFENSNLLDSEKPSKEDRQAKKEEKAFFRGEKIKEEFHFFTIWTLRLAFTLAIFLIIIRMFHFMVPTCWRWLEVEDLQMIDKFLFSGVLGAMIGRHLNKIID